MNRYKYHNFRGEHLHTLDGRPLIGTSSVLKVIAKPLTWYGSGKAVETFGAPDAKVLTKIKHGKATEEEIKMHRAGLRMGLELIQGMTLGDYEKLIDKAYRAHNTHKEKAAVKGTDLHKEVEAYIKWRMNCGDNPAAKSDMIGAGVFFSDRLQPFMDWADEKVKRFLWSEAHCYSEKYWLGGISDAGYETHEGKFGFFDAKSSKDVYMDQLWQCAGYAIQIEENGLYDADGAPIATPWLGQRFDEICVFNFGGENPKPSFNYDMPGSKEAFLAALCIYKKLPQD